MIGHAVMLASGANDDARRGYLAWLHARMLRPRFSSDPELLSTVASVLARTVNELIRQAPPVSTEEGAVARLLWQRVYEDLPASLRQELGKNADLMAKLGMRWAEFMDLDGLAFEVEDYWRAAADAVNGATTALTTADGKRTVMLEPYQVDGRLRARVRDDARKTYYVVDVAEIDLLVDSVSGRETAATHLLRSFDVPPAALAEEVARIVTIDDPARRMREIGLWQERSAGAYYRSLAADLREPRDLNSERLRPPGIEGLLRHFRLEGYDGSAPFRPQWDAAMESLLADEGLEVALFRACAAPIRLPSRLVEVFAAASTEQQQSALRQILRWGSPVASVHSLHLLARLEADPYNVAVARWQLRALLSGAGSDSVDAFITLSRWVNDQFFHRPEARAVNAELRLVLVWAHAHNLFAAFTAAGARRSWVKSYFESDRHISAEWFERDPVAWNDIAHPSHASTDRFLVGGLAYALQSHESSALDANLTERLRRRFFPGSTPGPTAAAIELLLDVDQATNGLGTFLGGPRDEQLAALFGPDLLRNFSSESIRAMASEAIDELVADATTRSAWLTLHLILGELPPADELRARLTELIRSTDFSLLTHVDPATAMVAARVSANALQADDDELRMHVEQGVVSIADNLATSGGSGSLNNEMVHPLALVDTALQLEARPGLPLGVTVGRFTELTRRLVEAWPDASRRVAPAIVKLCEDLPVTVTRALWQLVLELRARY